MTKVAEIYGNQAGRWEARLRGLERFRVGAGVTERSQDSRAL